MNDIEQKAFEDESTIHFGGDGEEIDFFAGFDDDAGTQAAPTTEQQSAEPEDSGEAEESAAQDGDGEEAPTTEQQSAEPEKLTFKAKIDHQEQDVSIEADELPTIYQKAQNMDRAVQRANKAQQDMEQYQNSMEEIASMARALGFNGETPEAAIRAMMTGVTSSTREQRVEALVNDGTAKEVAEFIVDQQMKPVPVVQTHEPEVEDGQQQEEPDIQDEAAGDVDDGSQPPSPEQFNLDLQKLLARRPGILESGKPFPEEVLSAYMKGENLTVAYLDYESKQSAAERQELEKQNRIFRQNQESAQRAPVKGVSGSGGITSKEDPWLAGIDDTYW